MLLGHKVPPFTSENNDEEMPCSLYIIRPGSRRIVSNTTDGQRLNFILQFPSRTGHISVLNFISAPKVSLTQMNISYLDANQSHASSSNRTALRFVAPPKAFTMAGFPAHVPVQKLQVNISGVPNPLPPTALEIQIIICYERISKVKINNTKNFIFIFDKYQA